MRRGYLLLALAACGCLACVTTTAGTQPSASTAKAASCGKVRARGENYRVRVVQGRLGCRSARHVVRYVLTHGEPTQGSPGRAPKGWTCGYGYGRDSNGNTVRAGPACERGSIEVEGIDTHYRPA